MPFISANAPPKRPSRLYRKRACWDVRRSIHFATHGLLASESESVGGAAEPALLLTPPVTASEADDGLLTASEVARLKLDADWVVLSACNTAAGGGGDERLDMLSGLARSFFYAGARALMVSHWAVDSDATVKLVTGTFGHLRTNPNRPSGGSSVVYAGYAAGWWITGPSGQLGVFCGCR